MKYILLIISLVVLSACKTVTPVNVSHIDKVVGDAEKIVVVKVIRFYMAQDKIYIYGKADGKPVLIESVEAEKGLSTFKEIKRGRRYLFLLKRTQIYDLKKICRELKLPDDEESIECFKSYTVGPKGYVKFIDKNSFGL